MHRCLDGYCGAFDCVRCYGADAEGEDADPDDWAGPFNEDDNSYEEA